MVIKYLTLIRHCESAANAGLATSDPALIPLTERGHAQAKVVAYSMTECPDLIVASPMMRALQTAHPFRERFPSVPFETWPVQEFVFMNFGKVETTPQVRRPMVRAYWSRLDPDELSPSPGSESFREFYSRVVSFHQRVLICPARTLVVYTHGFFLHALIHLNHRKFPPCTQAIMADIYAESLQVPYANGQAIYLECE